MQGIRFQTVPQLPCHGEYVESQVPEDARFVVEDPRVINLILERRAVRVPHLKSFFPVSGPNLLQPEL